MKRACKTVISGSYLGFRTSEYWRHGVTEAQPNDKRKERGFDTRGANMGRRERAGSIPARPTRNKKKGELSIDQKENDSGGEAGASRQEKRGSDGTT